MTIETTGTCYQGTIKSGFGTLCHMLGKPEYLVNDFKCDVQWVLTFDDGSIATIYNWKNGKNYCGPEGLNVKEITLWNVGGLTGSEGVARLQRLFEPLTYGLGIRGH